MPNNAKDTCVYCGGELSKWEAIRSHCWECNELISDTYHEVEE